MNDKRLLKLLRWARKFFNLTLHRKTSDLSDEFNIYVDALAPIISECNNIQDPYEQNKWFIKGIVWAKQNGNIPYKRESLTQLFVDTGVCRTTEESNLMLDVLQGCIDEGIIIETRTGMLLVPEKEQI